MAFGGVQAVDGADLVAEPGAIVGLIGPNGSGKTTMLDVISGLVTPQAGSVRLDGGEPGRVPARGALLPRAWCVPSRTAGSSPSSAWKRCCG